MKEKDALAIFEAELKRLNYVEGGVDGSGHVAWLELFARQSEAEWLVTDVWPKGRQVHMHAARKTGKSLVALWIAGNLAIGRDPFTGAPQERVRVGYLDFEMTEDDLLERVEAMEFTADQLTDWLFYFLHPVLPMLDTPAGGEALMRDMRAHGIQACIIDTMSRVVAGEENSNDTYIRFYKNTGMLLKADGIALLRLDHEGHEAGRSRGASSKADDVDVVWQLRQGDGHALELVRKAARISWVPETVIFNKAEEPLRFTRTGELWPVGTAEKAAELDKLGVPVDASRRKASDALKQANVTVGKTAVLVAALKYRKTRIMGI